MSFLVDHQLPPALAIHLSQKGHPSAHVADLGLDTADDSTVRARASLDDMVMISKDEDFFHLTLKEPTGPALIWVRLGNCRTRHLLNVFDQQLHAIILALQNGQRIIELR